MSPLLPDQENNNHCMLQEQLHTLLRQQAALHDEMVAILRKPPHADTRNGTSFTWAELHAEYKRLEGKINQLRRQIN